MKTLCYRTIKEYNRIAPSKVHKEKLTIPGQGLTVKELIRRLEAGIEIRPIKGVYNSINDMIIPRMNIKSLSDLDKARTYIEDVKKRTLEREKFIKKQKETEAKKQASEVKTTTEN